jgi:aryl-alcohol dehydrogenase-like predicted oxidoreductase
LSEIRIRKALRDGNRDRVFLMTKIDGRSKKRSGEATEQSLCRLQVDMIDLVQLPEVLR